MKKQPMRATALVAAGVIAGGIMSATLGAQAANHPTGDVRPAYPAHARAHGEGAGGPVFGGDLAKELGVSEAKLREAIDSIREDIRPARRPEGPPSEADRAAMENKLAAGLADKLDLSEAKVKAALEKVRAAHAAERRAFLSDRLDQAVQAGKLSAADKASVLKAFDAGVLGGPGLW